jgi:hypothetical protein
MNFLRKNLFLKLIKEFQKSRPENRDTWQHQGVPRGMLTSAGGSGMLTSAVGPADVSVDRSTLTGQRSTVNGRRAPLVSLGTRLTGGPHGSGQNRKREKGFRSGLVLGQKR